MLPPTSTNLTNPPQLEIQVVPPTPRHAPVYLPREPRTTDRGQQQQANIANIAPTADSEGVARREIVSSNLHFPNLEFLTWDMIRIDSSSIIETTIRPTSLSK